MKRVFLSENIRDQVCHLPPNLKKKIRNAFDEILTNPSIGKALEEELAGLLSYKLGRVRIVYKITHPEITIVAMGPRKTIYEKVIFELRRK